MLQLHFGVLLCDSGGIRTHDLRLRRPLLYPAELLNQHFYGLAVQIYAIIFLFQKNDSFF